MHKQISEQTIIMNDWKNDNLNGPVHEIMVLIVYLGPFTKPCMCNFCKFLFLAWRE